MENALDTLRKAIHRRHRDSNIATLARDISVSANALDAFIYHEGILSEAAVHKLVDYAFAGLMKLEFSSNSLTYLPGPPALPFMMRAPEEYISKPPLSREQRLPKAGGLYRDRGFIVDPKFDQRRGPRRESTGALEL